MNPQENQDPSRQPTELAQRDIHEVAANAMKIAKQHSEKFSYPTIVAGVALGGAKIFDWWEIYHDGWGCAPCNLL